MISSLRIRIGRITFNSVNHYKMKSEQKEAMQLKKMMEKMKSREKKPRQYPKLLEKRILPSPYENEGTSKRVTVLNKVYMEHVTLMLSSGIYGRQFDDLGIEITKVNLSSSLDFLNLYWVTRKQDIPEHVINDTLCKALVELQEKMGGMRFISKVPFLRFVKDVRLEREIQLEKIFESADFGRDFQPVYGKKVITQDFAPKPSEMPEMRQNVLGLDHAKIKGRILAEIAKFKAINTAPMKEEEEDDEERHETPHKLIKFSKNEFFKFYKRRRILALKMKKQQQKEAYDNVENEYVNTYEYEEENENEDDMDVDEYEEYVEEEVKK